MPSIWKPRAEAPVPPEAAAIAEDLHVSPLIAGILWNRGLHTRADMDRFLSPMLRHLADPKCIPGLEDAASALAEGLVAGKRFAVWGDYDVDGITSTALIKDFLGSYGYEVRHHLPNRLEEGYGLSVAGIERLAAEGVELLLTVDCGVTDVIEVRRANELGMTVVVSDHHLPGEELPPAAAICNPRLACDAECPCEALAGVGVAFMLMVALRSKLENTPREGGDVRKLLDLVALGTVADVVGLTGQNRILVKNGLLCLKDPHRPGILALKTVSGYDRLAEIGAGQVGFQLAPRLNAAGRLGDPEKALGLLLAEDLNAAKPVAAFLDGLNSDRRKEEEHILEEALEQAEHQAKAGRMGMVLHAENWHPGIIGIVASRVVERFYRPVVLLCSEEGVVKGSGRSIEEFHLHEALTAMSELFLQFGGHRQAAGMSMEPGRLNEFRERFDAAARESLGDKPLTPTLKYDLELDFASIDNILLRELELLQPFGMGNAEPVFISPPVLVREHKVFGKGHVRLQLLDPERRVTLTAKAWRQAETLGREVLGKTVQVAYHPRIDTYGPVPKIELQLKDWRYVTS